MHCEILSAATLHEMGVQHGDHLRMLRGGERASLGPHGFHNKVFGGLQSNLRELSSHLVMEFPLGL